MNWVCFLNIVSFGKLPEAYFNEEDHAGFTKPLLHFKRSLAKHTVKSLI